jgi:hypothetical protein
MELQQETGNLDRTLSVAGAIVADFEVDELSARARVLRDFASSVLQEADAEAFAAALRRLVEEAVAADRYDLALELVDALRTDQRVLRIVPLRKMLLDAREPLLEQKRQWEEVVEAQRRLQEAPEDGEANLTCGLWYCRQKNDWQQGLPFLANGSHAKLKAGALAELKNPATLQDQVQAADLWFEAAAADPDLAVFLERAADLYRKALPTTAGLEQARIKKRLQEIDKTPSGSEEPERADTSQSANKVFTPRNAAQFGGHSYAVIHREMTWHRALWTCEQLGGHLVRIESPEEQQFIHSLIGKESHGGIHWTDLSDEVVEGDWRYSDGRKALFTAWARGQPSGGAQHHATIGWAKSGLWDDNWAGVRLRFICEWEITAEAAQKAGVLVDSLDDRLSELEEAIDLPDPAQTRGKPKAPPGAVKSQGHRYWIFPQKSTWHVARRVCEGLGGHLVRIETREEQRFLHDLIQLTRADEFWTDLSDERKESRWEFSDGRRPPYMNWAARQPRRGNHVMISKDGNWRSSGPGERLPFICEWDF